MDLRDLPSIDGLASAMTAEFGRIPRPVVVADMPHSPRPERAVRPPRWRQGPTRWLRPRTRLSDIDAARPQAVINATGVLLHTNLGRASMPPSAAARLGRPGNNARQCGDRHPHRPQGQAQRLPRALLPAATGAQAGFAVNNNAGALLLALASVAGDGGKVACLARRADRNRWLVQAAGADAGERSHAGGGWDDEPNSAVRLRCGGRIRRCHPEGASVELSHRRIPGRGVAPRSQRPLRPSTTFPSSSMLEADSWMRNRPGWATGLAAGLPENPASRRPLLQAPISCCSPGTSSSADRRQASSLGQAPLLRAAARHPIARAVRLDGGTIAAVAETVEMYLDKRVLDIPFWAMAAASLESVDTRAQAVAAGIEGVTIEDSGSVPGAGSVPGLTIPTRVLRLPGNADAVWSSLASAQPPVIGTRRDGAVYLDLRSVPPELDDKVAAAIRAAYVVRCRS